MGLREYPLGSSAVTRRRAHGQQLGAEWGSANVFAHHGCGMPAAVRGGWWRAAAASLASAYRSWQWRWRDMVFYVLVSSKYPVGTTLRLRNGWTCAVVLNDPSWCVALRVLGRPPGAFMFITHFRGARMAGEVLSADGRTVARERWSAPGALPCKGESGRPVRCDGLAMCKLLVELRALLGSPNANLYREMLHRALGEQLHRFERAAACIQRHWRRCIGDPSFLVCRNRLTSEFASLVCA